MCDVNVTSLYFHHGSVPTHHARDTTTDISLTIHDVSGHNIELLWRITADFVASNMWPPNSSDLIKSGGLCHLVCHSATCVRDQSSWHRRAATASTACVMQLGAAAVADWWCGWPMPNTLACLCSCQRRTFWTYFVIINIVFRVLDAPCLTQQVTF